MEKFQFRSGFPPSSDDFLAPSTSISLFTNTLSFFSTRDTSNTHTEHRASERPVSSARMCRMKIPGVKQWSASSFLLASPASRFTRFLLLLLLLPGRHSRRPRVHHRKRLAARACGGASGAEGDLVPTERESGGNDRKMGQIAARAGGRRGGMSGRTDERTECFF